MDPISLKLDFDESRTAVDGLIASNGGRIWFDGYAKLIGSIEELEHLRLSELRRGIKSLDRYVSGGTPEAEVVFFPVAQEHLEEDEEGFAAPQVSMEVLPDRVHILCTTLGELGGIDDYETTGRRLSALLVREKLMMLEMQTEDLPTATWAQITVEVKGRGRTVGDALAAGSRLLHLWEATLYGDLDLSGARDLLESGEPQLLIGQPESQWLEVKRQPHHLGLPEQDHELAKDVAAMANGGGGLIVIGLATKQIQGTDTVDRVNPIPLGMLNAAGYRRAVEKLVYPPPEGFEVRTIEIENGSGVAVLDIPPQPEESKPLLILGAIVGKKISGSYVSLVRRLGAETYVSHPAAIHSLFAAGRVALGVTQPSGDRRTE